MPKKCPPGVFCIENMTLTLLFAIVGIVIIYAALQFKHMSRSRHSDHSNVRENVIIIKENEQDNTPFYMKPSSMFRNAFGDTFLNPYAPPLKENPFLASLGIEGGYKRVAGGLGVGSDPRGVPINIPTSHFDLDYKQVGILTRSHGKDTILALFGRPVHSNRNKWQYYTMTDKNQMIKLPLSKAGRSCSSEYGCDEIYNGDSVYVEGYNDAFKATIYENGTPRYIPFV
jgi:hypothetical protein